MKKFIKKAIKNIVEIIFPVYCLGCGKEGFWICRQCVKKIQYINTQTPSPKLDKTNLSHLFIVCNYQDKIIQKGIHLLKYQYARDLRMFFRQVLTNSTLQGMVFGRKECLIIPIPLHQKRKRFRGFNQSDILAQEIAALLKIPCKTDILIRKRDTRPQVGLNLSQRNINIKEAFKVRNNLEISPESVILIDDVYTTGSTMNEAAKVLKKAGIKEVNGIVIAKG